MSAPVPQPAKGILAMQRTSNARVARLYGCSPHYVGRVLNGYEKPPARFELFLSELTGQSTSTLFREEALDEVVA